MPVGEISFRQLCSDLLDGMPMASNVIAGKASSLDELELPYAWYSSEDIRNRLWMVFLPAIFMTFVGGGVSGMLIKRGWDIGKARKTVMLVFGLMMIASIGVGFVESAVMALVLSTTALMAFYGYSVNTLTLPADLVPPRLVASVSGLSGTGAGIGSVIFTFIVGYLADVQQSFTSVFVLVGMLPLASLAMLFFVVGKVKRVVDE